MNLSQVLTRVKQTILDTRDWIKSDKRIYIPLIAFLLIAVLVGGYFGYRAIVARWSVPEVRGANFSLEYRKIPFDVKSLDITFSTDMDAGSTDAKSVTLAPFVE